MSIEAMRWAMDLELETLASPTARYVLLILGNYAGEDGKHAFPAIQTIARKTGFKERTVQKALRQLEDLGIVRLGNQAIVAAHIDRPDKRPTVYDLALQSCGSAGETAVEKGGDRGEPRSPRAPAGRTSEQSGVNLTTERGEPRSPDPSNNPIEKTRARGGDPDGPPRGAKGGGEAAHQAGAAPPAGAAPGPAEKRAPTAREQLLFMQETVIVDWLTGRTPLTMILRDAGLDPGLDFDGVAKAIETLDPVALRAVRGLIGWAHRCHHADPAVRPPQGRVVRLIEAMGDAAARPMLQWRCARLLGRPFKIDARPDDFGKPPGAGGAGDDDQQTDHSKGKDAA